MVKIMENPIKIDDLGGNPTIFGNIQLDDELFEPLGYIGVITHLLTIY